MNRHLHALVYMKTQQELNIESMEDHLYIGTIDRKGRRIYTDRYDSSMNLPYICEDLKD